MFERFTDRARKVLQLANQEAARCGHETVDPVHVLIGLIKEGSGVACNVLKNLNVGLHAMREEAEKRFPGGASARPMRPEWKQLRSAATTRALELAVGEATGLGHNYVGTEHVLLGLLCCEDAVVAVVWASCSVSAADVREEVLNLLGVKPAGVPPEPAPDIFTAQEQAFLQATADLFAMLVALPVLHPDDLSESRRDVHGLQNRVLARPAMRALRHALPSPKGATS